jgi:hypothetical protein
MKEQTLIEIKNKVEMLGKVAQKLLNETEYLKDLAIGTLETIKLMEGYEQAINKLKEKMAEKPSEGETTFTHGKTS